MLYRGLDMTCMHAFVWYRNTGICTGICRYIFERRSLSRCVGMEAFVDGVIGVTDVFVHSTISLY